MCVLSEINFYENKILKFDPDLLDDEPEKLIYKEIKDLQVCWDKFQTFHNKLMEEAELKSDSSETKAVLNKKFAKVQKHFESSINSLKSFLKPSLVRSAYPDILDDDDGLSNLSSTSDGKSMKRKLSQSLEAVSEIQAGPSSSELKHKRKTSHKSLLIDCDNDITFETYVVPSDEDDDITSNNDKESLEKKRKIDYYANHKNPNDDLLWNVAFLMSCVNNTMKRIGYRAFDFEEPISLPKLISKYYENKIQQGKNL